MNLSKNTKTVRVSNAVAVGTGAVNCTAVDMSGFDGVMYVCQFGTITDGTPSIKAQQDSASGMGTAQDLASSSVAGAVTDDNLCYVLDVYKPTKRYNRCVITRGGATGAVIDSVLAILYAERKLPTTTDATVAQQKTLVSPAEGTA